jgi:hypothetical protein
MLRLIAYRSNKNVFVVVLQQDETPARYAVIALWPAADVALEQRDIEGQFNALKLMNALLQEATPPPTFPSASSLSLTQLDAAAGLIEAMAA